VPYLLEQFFPHPTLLPVDVGGCSLMRLHFHYIKLCSCDVALRCATQWPTAYCTAKFLAAFSASAICECAIDFAEAAYPRKARQALHISLTFSKLSAINPA